MSSGRRVVMDGEDGDSKSSRPLTLDERFSNLPAPPRQDVKTNFAVNLNAAVKEQRQINKQAAQRQQRQNVVTKRRIATAPDLPATQNLRESLSRPNTRSRGGLAPRGGARGRGRAPVSITSTRGTGRGAFRGRGRGRGAVAASVPAGRGRGRGRGAAIAKGGRAAALASAPAVNGAPRGRGRGAAAGRGRGRGGARGRGRGGRGGSASSGSSGDIDKDALDAEMDLYMGKDPAVEKLDQELEAYSAQRSAKDASAATK